VPSVPLGLADGVGDRHRPRGGGHRSRERLPARAELRANTFGDSLSGLVESSATSEVDVLQNAQPLRIDARSFTSSRTLCSTVLWT